MTIGKFDSEYMSRYNVIRRCISTLEMRHLFSEFLLAPSKKVKSECFATLNATFSK